LDAVSHCIESGLSRPANGSCRRGVADKLAQFRQFSSPATSCRQIAKRIRVPQRTLAHRVRRQRFRVRRSAWSPEVVAFFESPQGLEFLHRLSAAIHLVFVQANDAGIRSVTWFLRRSGLAEFIAPSYGAQRAIAEERESLLIRFGQQEDERLAREMPPQEITLCEDETFHPRICLVGIEPVSDFLLLEQYQPQRDDMAFFWTTIGRRLTRWALEEPLRVLLVDHLLPGYYLQQAASKATEAAEKQRLRRLSEEILARARSPDGLWATLSPQVRADLEAKARRCAAIFQRSSSCVEGRNGQLSLKHHALHQLTPRKLLALTTLHNYGLQRPDGTTAAERFYGSRPQDLFAWLLRHLSPPALPRAIRRAA
jgi:hypothetical protein